MIKLNKSSPCYVSIIANFISFHERLKGELNENSSILFRGTYLQHMGEIKRRMIFFTHQISLPSPDLWFSKKKT